MDIKYNLTFHHTGCITHSIENSKPAYAAMGFRQCSDTFIINAQKVKVCFIEISPGVFLELVEPFEDNSTLHKYLKSKTTFYHLGFLTGAFEETIEKLQADGFYLINTFQSEAFSNKLCAFLYTSEMQLIEIIQA